jgi:putative spermidine/putrescine transport system ATP-binding protein
LIQGEVSKRITGKDTKFSIRPEKIHLSGPEEKIATGMFSADGKVRDVVYLGLYTRYLVELEGGGDLVVVEQNLDTTSMDVMKARGQKVRVFWKKEHVRILGGPDA